MKTREEKREYQREYDKTHRKEKREYSKTHRKEKREYDKTHKNERKHNLLKASYGITLEEYKKLLVKQNGVCAICLQEEKAASKGILRMLSVDHDHKTGKIRGLLCSSCNMGLGYFKDNPIITDGATKYLTS